MQFKQITRLLGESVSELKDRLSKSLGKQQKKGLKDGKYEKEIKQQWVEQ